jgi:hypothetical protein
MFILLGEIPQAWLPSQFHLENSTRYRPPSTGVMAKLTRTRCLKPALHFKPRSAFWQASTYNGPLDCG